jgi:hypothetical protein
MSTRRILFSNDSRSLKSAVEGPSRFFRWREFSDSTRAIREIPGLQSIIIFAASPLSQKQQVSISYAGPNVRNGSGSGCSAQGVTAPDTRSWEALMKPVKTCVQRY